jgi:peptidoglycan/LPS O-acetylase OafA/YrhL
MKRVPTLDGLRGIAVLMVIAGHTVANYQPLTPELRQWLGAFANAGAGVRLFFVLSGYLITSLLVEEQDQTQTIALGQFYWRRMLRIFPAFYTYLGVLLLLNAWHPMGLNRSTATAAGTFTWNYSFLWVVEPGEGSWNLGHLWTLALEQQFYLFWPAVLLLVGQRKGLPISLLLAAWCPLARVFTYYAFPSHRGHLVMMLHTGIDSLMIGCAAAMLARKLPVRVLLEKHGGAAALASAVWLLCVSPAVSEMLRGFPAVAGYTLDALAASVVIVWVHHQPPAWVRACLGNGILPALGVISYSLYLWQQVFLRPNGWLAEGHIILPCAAAIAAATCSYFLIERTALALKTRLRRRAQPAVA